MDDQTIIELYFARSEQAIAETADKYGPLLHSLARNILQNRSDCEEAVNDTYLGAWAAIPPQRPASLRNFLARITRNICFDRLDRLNAAKRRGSTLPLQEELAGCIPDEGACVERQWEARELARSLDEFLGSLEPEVCAVFVSRYFYSMPIARIAQRCRIPERRVKYLLARTRARLRDHLQRTL